MTITSFAIILYGQCCRRHVVGQQVVRDVSVVRSCWIICSLCSESGNANLLLRACSLHTWNVYFVSRNLTYNMAACAWWP